MVHEVYPNPFAPFYEELKAIKDQLKEISEAQTVNPQSEVISDKTLCERLEITRQTLNRWRKQGRIPFIQIGSVLRYDYPKVLEALEKGGY